MWYFTYAEYPNGVYQGQVTDFCKSFSAETGKKVRLVALLSLRHYWSGRKLIKELYPRSFVIPMVPTKRLWILNLLILIPLSILSLRSTVMCRGVFATNLAIMIRRLGLFRKVIYDGRGAISAELQEYNVTPDQWIIRRMPNWESFAVRQSDFRNAVSSKLVDYWKKQFQYDSQTHVVIPCTVNSIFEQTAGNNSQNAKKLDGALRLVYSGSVAGWQSIDQVCAFAESALEKYPDSTMLFLCGEHPDIERLEKQFRSRVSHEFVDPSEIPARLQECNLGIMIREQSVTNRVASPTKFAEYLACGLKVVITEELGDQSAFVKNHRCGVVHSISDSVLDSLPNVLTNDVNPASLCLEYFGKESEGVKSAFHRLSEQLA
ncbi:MAG: hypothetical protein P8M80_10530 [Pirellulaceae bacterium]|nr:hypothetical protein [Pirellulaceae bacterium]